MFRRYVQLLWCANAKEKGHSCGLIFSGHLFVPVFESIFITQLCAALHSANPFAQSPFFAIAHTNPAEAKEMDWQSGQVANTKKNYLSQKRIIFFFALFFTFQSTKKTAHHTTTIIPLCETTFVDVADDSFFFRSFSWHFWWLLFHNSEWKKWQWALEKSRTGLWYLFTLINKLDAKFIDILALILEQTVLLCSQRTAFSKGHLNR